MFIRYDDRPVRPAAGVIRSQAIRHYADTDMASPLSSLPDAEWALLAA